MENKINLFEIYNYHPYDSSKVYIDDLITTSEQNLIYEVFKKSFLCINKEIYDELIDKDFFFSSNNFILCPPNTLVFNLFIKSIILDRVQSLNSSIEFFIGANDQELDLNSRFANLYAILVKSIKGKSSFTLNYIKSNSVNYEQITSAKNKLLSILNFNVKYILFFFINKLNFLYKKKILKIGDNYIIRDIEADLLMKGYKTLDIKKDLLKIFNRNNDLIDSKYSHYDDKLKSIIDKNLENIAGLYFKDIKLYESYSSVLSLYLNQMISQLLLNKNLLRKKVSEFKTFNICLGNGLFGIPGKAIYDALKYNGIDVLCSEHGLTDGIADRNSERIFNDESLTSDYLLCYNEASISVRSSNLNSNTILINSGGNSTSKKIRNKLFQSIFLRIKYRIFSKTVFYVSDTMEFNTGKSYPGASNSNIFLDEKNILTVLSKTNKKVIYKPYPSRQYYANRLSFLYDHIKHFKNFFFFQEEEDFRYVRSLANIIITQANESTLEWCIGSEVPLVYLESSKYNSLKDDKVIEVFKKSFFFFNCDYENWEKDLLDFLNLPMNTIDRLWKEKNAFRKKYDNLYFMSNKKNAGKIGSKIILKHMNG